MVMEGEYVVRPGPLHQIAKPCKPATTISRIPLLLKSAAARSHSRVKSIGAATGKEIFGPKLRFPKFSTM